MLNSILEQLLARQKSGQRMGFYGSNIANNASGVWNRSVPFPNGSRFGGTGTFSGPGTIRPQITGFGFGGLNKSPFKGISLTERNAPMPDFGSHGYGSSNDYGTARVQPNMYSQYGQHTMGDNPPAGYLNTPGIPANYGNAYIRPQQGQRPQPYSSVDRGYFPGSYGAERGPAGTYANYQNLHPSVTNNWNSNPTNSWTQRNTGYGPG